MYRKIKRIRVAVSIVCLTLLTLAVIDTGFALSPLGRWMQQTQLIPAILTGAAAWLMVWVVVSLSFGRVYCSTVCPLGTVQDIAAHLGRRFSKGAGSHYRYSRPIDSLRYPIPLIVAACLCVGLTKVVEATDPYSIYCKIAMAICRPLAISLGGAAAAIVVLLVICGVAWRKGRLICNTVCPAGGLLGLLGRRPVYAVDINTDKCIHCGKCEDVCKSSCIDLRDCVVDNSRCVMCINCTAVCPNDAITVRRGRHQLSLPMMQRTSTSMSASQPHTSCSSSHTRPEPSSECQSNPTKI